MENTLFAKILVIDKSSPIPIYKQMADSILQAVERNELNKGDICPSINQLSSYFNISRATVEKAFFVLRKQGIISAFHGKCYYIARITPEKHPFGDTILYKSLYP